MENPIIRIAAKFQYKNPSLPTLAVMDTISWSLGRPHRKSRTFLQRSWIRKAGRSWCEHFSRQLVMKTSQWNVIYYYCWWWWYLLLRLLVLRPSIWSLLQSATAYFTKCDSVFLQSATSGITKCDKWYYKVRQTLRSAMILLQSAIGITRCDRTDGSGRGCHEFTGQISVHSRITLPFGVVSRITWLGDHLMKSINDS